MLRSEQIGKISETDEDDFGSSVDSEEGDNDYSPSPQKEFFNKIAEIPLDSQGYANVSD